MNLPTQEVSSELIHSDANNVLVDHMQAPNFPDGHWYQIYNPEKFTVDISFQNGPVKEHGVNGITNEALLAIILHRLRVLNQAYPCRENSLAITNIEQGLMWLEQRTKDRQKRGVEGFNKA
ncbi:MAG: hypothetical protein VX136_09420 [Pseudomonadota bacterium]|nr:hypothetical protein [Pseudomonadota bacterium]